MTYSILIVDDLKVLDFDDLEDHALRFGLFVLHILNDFHQEALQLFLLLFVDDSGRYQVLEAFRVDGIDPPVVNNHIELVFEVIHFPLLCLQALDIAHHTNQHVQKMNDREEDTGRPEEPKEPGHRISVWCCCTQVEEIQACIQVGHKLENID